MSAVSSPADTGLLDLIPFAKSCGIELAQSDPSCVVARMPWAPERCTAGGVLHGGAVMTLADTAGAVCAFLNLPEGATTTTIESKTNFLRGIRSGNAEATATPLHVGGSTIVVQTDVRDGDGNLVAHVVQTQAVRLAS